MDGLLAAPPLRVVKLGPDRSRVFAWDGRQLERTPEHILLAGFFTRLRRDLGYVVLEQGDLFLEWYYFGRWYNIFQIYSTSGHLKGWYCNIGMPPQLVDGELHYVDLALDVFVFPDGRHLVLDQDEFDVLKAEGLDPAEAAGAEQGLTELLALVTSAALPSRAYEPEFAALAG